MAPTGQTERAWTISGACCVFEAAFALLSQPPAGDLSRASDKELPLFSVQLLPLSP